MVEIERINVCPVAYCPAPNDPDWHVCAVCGALAIEHDHTRGRGKLTLEKRFVVAKCRKHHDMVTFRYWGREWVEPDDSKDGRRHYYEFDRATGDQMLHLSLDYMQGDANAID